MNPNVHGFKIILYSCCNSKIISFCCCCNSKMCVKKYEPHAGYIVIEFVLVLVLSGPIEMR